MTYEAAPLPLKDGSVCFFRNPKYSDAAAFAGFSYQVRTETDFLLALPEEVEQNTEKVAQRLEATTGSWAAAGKYSTGPPLESAFSKTTGGWASARR